MESIYQAPASDVTQQDSVSGSGSVEKAVAGEYDFSIGGTLSEAWEKTSGAKLTIHLGYLVMVGVCLAIGLAALLGGTVLAFSVGLLSPALSTVLNSILAIVMYIVVLGVLSAMWAGLFMMGARRAVNAPITAMGTLQYLNKTAPLLGVYIVSTIFTQIGLLLLVVPGVYLAIAYLFAIPLRADKDLTVWESLETSRKAVTHRWFAFFGLTLLLLVINLIAMIPLGLGLIWTVPLSHLAVGIAYRNMFGVNAEARQS